jgi:hypothetical protein
MSADNYYRVTKEHRGYVVRMHWASGGYSPHSIEFDTLKEAVQYAADQDAEYGVALSPEVIQDLP